MRGKTPSGLPRPHHPRVRQTASAIFWRATLLWLSSLLILVAGAWLVCPQGLCEVNPIDRFGLDLAHDWRGKRVDQWMLGATWFGSLLLLLPLATLAAWRLNGRRRRADAGFVLAALLGASALAHVTKLWTARPRPELYPAWGAIPTDWSYPSAHAMQATALGLALLLVAGRRWRAWALPLLVVVLLVGLSRVYLQVHFPSDVLVGMGAASLWVAGLHTLIVRPPFSSREAAPR